jgi:hypothetical protein
MEILKRRRLRKRFVHVDKDSLAEVIEIIRSNEDSITIEKKLWRKKKTFSGQQVKYNEL